MLFTLTTAEVTSKTARPGMGARTLDPTWRPLLGQVRDERAVGWVPGRGPRPGEADAARAFAAYAVEWASARTSGHH